MMFTISGDGYEHRALDMTEAEEELTAFCVNELENSKLHVNSDDGQDVTVEVTVHLVLGSHLAIHPQQHPSRVSNHPHPSRVTVSDDEFQVTGLQPRTRTGGPR